MPLLVEHEDPGRNLVQELEEQGPVASAERRGGRVSDVGESARSVRSRAERPESAVLSWDGKGHSPGRHEDDWNLAALDLVKLGLRIHRVADPALDYPGVVHLLERRVPTFSPRSQN